MPGIHNLVWEALDCMEKNWKIKKIENDASVYRGIYYVTKVEFQISMSRIVYQ